jgi:glucosamine-6-phosphate deaminase
MSKRAFGHVNLSVYESRVKMGEAAALEAAEHISTLLESKEAVRCVFAAAPSQREFLEALFSCPDVDFSRIEALHMDDYIGLEPGSPLSFRAFLAEYFNRVPMGKVHYIDGRAEPEKECARYGALLSENTIDVVFMGIGENGHIAFNDPAVADFNDPLLVKEVDLEESCRRQQVNDGCFPSLEEVPRRALTLTVPALLAADKHFCVVPGAAKARALRDSLLGPVYERCPASILRQKPGVRIFADRDSAALLPQSDG